MVPPKKPFQPSLLFVGKAGSLPLSGASEMGFTWVDSCLTWTHYTILERLLRNKHSSLLQIFGTYSHKKFYNIGPWSLRIEEGGGGEKLGLSFVLGIVMFL